MADDLALDRDASCRKCHSEIIEARAETTLSRRASPLVRLLLNAFCALCSSFLGLETD